jgi:predicted metalloprotease
VLDKLAEGLEKNPAAMPQTWDTNMSEEELAEWAFTDASALWAEAFANSGREYVDPQLWWVYNNPVKVEAGCGNAEGKTVFDPALGGPFWCSGNIYYTLYGDAKGYQYEEFGDFAVAIIQAHEVAHHVQWQLGYLDGSLYSIQEELQADCFAGVWADSVWRRNQLSDGDIDEAMTLLAAIGDPPGVSSDDPQAHGTPQQRQEWFNQGWITGDPSQCKTW